MGFATSRIRVFRRAPFVDDRAGIAHRGRFGRRLEDGGHAVEAVATRMHVREDGLHPVGNSLLFTRGSNGNLDPSNVLGSKGWIADSCVVPCDHVPVRSWPLFRAREVMPALIASFKQGKKS